LEQLIPLRSRRNTRVFISLLLSFAILIVPFTQMSLARGISRTVREGSATRPAPARSTAAELFVNPPSSLPAAQPEPAPLPFVPPAPAVDISAVMVGSPATVAPAGTINYTLTLGNTTGSEAQNLFFNDSFDSHTTFVPGAGAIKSSPVCRDKTIVTDEDTPIAITLEGQDPDGDTITFPLTEPGSSTAALMRRLRPL
jgi:uncharacterized repeat protein (TIGR01451 family)